MAARIGVSASCRRPPVAAAVDSAAFWQWEPLPSVTGQPERPADRAARVARDQAARPFAAAIQNVGPRRRARPSHSRYVPGRLGLRKVPRRSRAQIGTDATMTAATPGRGPTAPRSRPLLPNVRRSTPTRAAGDPPSCGRDRACREAGGSRTRCPRDDEAWPGQRASEEVPPRDSASRGKPSSPDDVVEREQREGRGSVGLFSAAPPRWLRPGSTPRRLILFGASAGEHP